MVVNLYETLWFLADQAREQGKPEEALRLYKRALALVGLDLEEVRAWVKEQ